MNYTKGENVTWEHKISWRNGEPIEAGIFAVMSDIHITRLAEIDTHRPEYEDNLHLMTAAPDLYEALKEIKNAYEFLQQQKPLLYNLLKPEEEKAYHRIEQALIKTEQAILKAEGK
jgi:hypothetical protein